LHAGVAVNLRERKKLERICRKRQRIRASGAYRVPARSVMLEGNSSWHRAAASWEIWIEFLVGTK